MVLAKPIACFGFRDGFASLNPSYGLITGALGPASDMLTRTPRQQKQLREEDVKFG
jgi:hypothetical protein